MRCIRTAVRLIAPAALICIGISASLSSRAQQYDVFPGYDLFESTAGTQFMGVAFTGVPLVNYNFGGVIGEQYVGDADTIIQRTLAAGPSSNGSTVTIPLVMDSLTLETTAPANFGAGVGNYFITLQSMQPTGGTPSTGTMAITYNTPTSGTFTSALDVFFDLTFGAVNGPVVVASDLELTNAGDTWSDIAPPGAILINGANNLLNGSTINNDFWPGTPLTEAHPGGVGIHVVTTADSLPVTTPEPGSIAVLSGMGIASLYMLRRRAR